MKQMNLLRVGVLLVAALFVVGALTTGGFAKYITGSTGNDTARVAAFGVEIFVGGNSFAKNYAPTVANGLTNAVLSSTTYGDSDVVAPGTNSTEAKVNSTFGAKGTPEVAVKVTAIMDDDIKDVYLPARDGYTDYTKITGYEDGKPIYGTFNLSEDYYPIKYTLTQTAPGSRTVVPGADGVNLSTIKDILEELGNTYQYEPGSDLNSTFELTWEWTFEGNDQADTLLGMAAANSSLLPDGASTTIAYNVTISVEQLD